MSGANVGSGKAFRGIGAGPLSLYSLPVRPAHRAD